jgi:hypothetical protein
MGGHARGHRFTQMATTSFIAPWCNNRGDKAMGPYRHSKHEFTHHPNSSHDAPSTSQDTVATVSKTDPMIVVGLLISQGSKAKPTR